jgi:hypothetical protein
MHDIQNENKNISLLHQRQFIEELKLVKKNL